ncbi:MAG: FecR domain-containing protein [Rhodocyclaceae bacterium]|nr:FecR domain-containing protein [Rhodocyclaceae bacterium]
MRGWLCALAFLPLPLQAANLAVVEAVQSPAWLDRGGRSEALAPGQAIRDGDSVRTGEGARLTLRLAEGSAVKLGENAGLALRGQGGQPDRSFKGAMDVLKGAFRFTTETVRRLRGERDIAIRVGTATMGIRGTDVWGKSGEDKDLICLIEGRIQVSHAALGGQPITMADAKTFFVAPRGAAPLPVGPVDPKQLVQWARETEIEPADGALRRGGRWSVQVGADAASQAEALLVHDQARLAGFATRIRTIRGTDGNWNYRVLLTGAASETDAAALAARVTARTELPATVRR